MKTRTLTILLTLSALALFAGAGCSSQVLADADASYRHAVASQSFTVSVDGQQQRVEAGTTIMFRDPLAAATAPPAPVKGGK